MEIFFNKRAMRQLRLSASDAADDGDTETLREDLIEVFSGKDLEELEHHLETGDLYEFVSQMLDAWDGQDVDELFELLEEELLSCDVELRFAGEEEVSGGDEDEDGDLEDDDLVGFDDDDEEDEDE